MKNKLLAFDFLRALAIVMIIPAHLSNYLFSTYSKLGLYAFDPYFANMGLGLFIFMSGFLLYYNNYSIRSFEDVFSFYRKRLLRIFPLYWAAIAVFILVFFIFAPNLNSGFVLPKAENVFGFFNILIHILGLQIFLAPAYASPMLTLYFIGLIIVFYTLYPILILFSKSSKQLVLYSLVVFFGFFLLSKILNIIDHRFFMFFPIFIFGILICKESLSEKTSRRLVGFSFVQILLAALPVIFVLTVVLGSRAALLLDPRVSLTIDSAGSGTIGSSTVISILNSAASALGINYTSIKFIIDSMLLNAFVILFCIFEYKFAMKFINGKFSSLLSSVFTLWNAGTNFVTNPVLRDVVVVFVAIPVLFFISYHIQILELNLKKFFSHEKVSSREVPFTESTFTEPAFAESTFTESATGSGK
jgi:hypothetical protein